MPLQFPDTGEPGGGAGTPSNGGSSVGSTGSTISSEPVTSVQAPNTPTATGEQGQAPRAVDYETHQAAIRGMNEAQRIKAEWEKTAQEFGFKTTEEAKAAFQAYQAMQTQPDVLIKNYFAQNPESLTTLLRDNPLQAAQIMGQVFNNQQQQSDPYENVSTYQELAQVLKQQLIGELKNEINPVIKPIQSFQAKQYESGIKAQLNPKIPEAVRESLWNEVAKIGIPMSTIEAQPWLIDGLIIQMSGGREKYEESIRNAAAATTAQNLTKKVEQNNNVASLTPGSGVSVSEINGPITDPDARRREALRRLELMQTVSGGG